MPPSEPPLASWIQRVGAFLVDFALTLPFSVVQNRAKPEAVVSTDVNGIASTTMTGGNIALVILMSLIILAISAYNRWYLGGRGQSLGKRVVGLTLVGETSGQPIGMGRALLRDLAHIIDATICFVGFLLPLWDSKRQTIADKFVATVVTAKG